MTIEEDFYAALDEWDCRDRAAPVEEVTSYAMKFRRLVAKLMPHDEKPMPDAETKRLSLRELRHGDVIKLDGYAGRIEEIQYMDSKPGQPKLYTLKCSYVGGDLLRFHKERGLIQNGISRDFRAHVKTKEGDCWEAYQIHS